MTDKPKLDPNVTIFATDEELVELMRLVGIPEKHARAAIQELDRNPYSGFPRKLKLYGDRRSWPDVREFLTRASRISPPPQARKSA